MGAFLRFGEMFCARAATRFEAAQAQAQARLSVSAPDVCVCLCVYACLFFPPLPLLSHIVSYSREALVRGSRKRAN